jgi:hypothetical protein
MAKPIKREVYYFKEPGEQNTEYVLEAVLKRVDKGGISKVIVASTSGETALKFAQALQGKVELFCVSEAPFRREWNEAWPCLTSENYETLKKLGVTVINNVPYVFHDSVVEGARWNADAPERLVKETLYCFGQGLKVAVEVALIAVSCGFVPPFEDVIAVGGSGRGADTAIILRGTYPASMFDKEPGKRLEIREIIAMPLVKKWWD